MQALGRAEEAPALARALIGGEDPASRRQAYAEACLAAWRLGADADLKELIAYVNELPPGEAVPSMRAQADRFSGLLAGRAAARGGADDLHGAAGRALARAGERGMCAGCRDFFFTILSGTPDTVTSRAGRATRPALLLLTR